MDNKMPSIGNFASMYRHKADYIDKEVEYTIKPKLHGTNGSIQIKDGILQCRSKNRILTPESDHMDFTKTMLAIQDQWRAYATASWGGRPITVYGEWAGPGVQQSDAVSLIDRKTFFVFAVYDHVEGVFTDQLHVMDHIDSDRVYEIPIIRKHTLNFNCTKPVQWFVDIINEEVEAMEEQDHFIKAAFDVDGVGEGVVGSPAWAPSHTYWAEHTFKAKTEAHRVKKTKAPASVKEPLPQEAFAFAETYVTEARMKQAMGELQIHHPLMSHTGDIIKWMNTDIIKESLDDVSDMGIDYGKMQKVINTRIVAMWKTFVETAIDQY